MKPELKKIFAGTLDVSSITNPVIKSLVNKLHSTGCKIENQTGGIIFRFPEHWVMYYSKTSGLIQTYYLGYGHCAQICPLQDFRNSDHIILWQEKNKSIELTPQPEIRLGERTYW